MLFLVLQCIENYETFSQKPRLDDDVGVDFYTTSLITVPNDDPEDEEWEDVESESDSMEDKWRPAFSCLQAGTEQVICTCSLAGRVAVI